MNSNITFPIRPDATTLLEQLRSGKTSSKALVKQHLEQLKKIQPTVNGATMVFEKEAIDLAEKLDKGGDQSLPLFGLPCSVKETFAMEGEEITAGSVRRVPDQCTKDAEMVRRLRAAGAVIIARSNIPEFAIFPSSESPIGDSEVVKRNDGNPSSESPAGDSEGVIRFDFIRYHLGNSFF